MTAPSMARIGLVRCLIAAMLFGASAPAASRLAGDIPPLTLAGLLYVGAALAVLPAVVRRRPTADAVKASWRPLAVAVLAGGAMGPVLLMAALSRIDAATAAILLNLELVATVVLARTVLVHAHPHVHDLHHHHEHAWSAAPLTLYMSKDELSTMTVEALDLLAGAVRVGRLRRGWTLDELAGRVGVSRPTITNVERGDPGVAIGTFLEAAHLVGVPLFDPEPDARGRMAAATRTELSLLPSTARTRRKVDDDF